MTFTAGGSQGSPASFTNSNPQPILNSNDKGWGTESSIEDVKLLPGVRRTMFRLQGGDWEAKKDD